MKSLNAQGLLGSLLAGPPCPAVLPFKPFWRCDLPRGHSGDHAQIAVRFFGIEAEP